LRQCRACQAGRRRCAQQHTASSDHNLVPP
jgi:hypothetical protein